MGLTTTSAATDRYISLNRTFHQLAEHAGSSDDVDLSQVFQTKSNLTWDDVLRRPRNVILSEAGSGKTEEIKQTAIRLRSENKAAFFLRLELIAQDWDIAFEVGTKEEFEDWLASTEPGWLLLDSVDEARLKNPQDFERAIRRLGREINTAKARVCIVLTGRTHAWRPKTDFDLCERHIGAPPHTQVPDDRASASSVADGREQAEDFFLDVEAEERAQDTDTSKFRIVALDDLSREQVTIFAKGKKVIDTAKFLDEIERADAWSSAARPQDLEDVIALWADTGRIGSRLEIVRNSIRRRLTERDQQRAELQSLSDVRVREGAMLLAAATTLTQSQVIRVPDGASNNAGISAKEVLPKWTDAEISELLSRPIFDEAIYGTVRFHHRSAREFLTAEWLLGLLEKPASRRSIEALLFKNQYGLDVVVPTMRPILPWLAISDSRIRERIRKIAPEVMFEGGDPAALPLPTRREILAEVCAKMANDTRVGSATEYSAVQRFAHPDVADQIGTLLGQYASNDEVVGFLVRMIWTGRLASLLPQAMRIGLSPITPRFTRIAAFRAVRVAGTASDDKKLREAFLAEAANLDRELAGELVSGLKPDKETISWVLSVSAISEPKRADSIDRLGNAVNSFAEEMDVGELPLLISGSARLLQEPPYVNRGDCEVSIKFSWMISAAAHAVERLIKARDPFALQPDSLEILHKFRALRDWREDARKINIRFKALVPAWQELNDASFWHDIEATRAIVMQKRGERLTEYWRAKIFGGFWQFSESDFDRVAGWISARTELDNKLVALTLAFGIFVLNGRDKDRLDQLKCACTQDEELSACLITLLKPSEEAKKHQREERKWKRESERWEERRSKKLEKDKAFIKANVHLARAPKLEKPSDISRVQWYLHEEMRQAAHNSSRWSNGNWRDLIPAFGDEVAQGFRDGAKAYWRRYRPVLRSEGAEANKTTIMTIFGLCGLQIEADDTIDWVQTLSKADADLASRYALLEMNGFPAWFPGVYAEHQVATSEIILGEIKYELSAGVEDCDSHYVLADISWSGEWAWNSLAPALYALLEAHDPENASHLYHLLKIVQGSDIGDPELARLASNKAVRNEKPEYAADWFAVWVGSDPSFAIPSLLQYLNGLRDAASQTLFAMQLVSKLWGGSRIETFGARGGFLQPQYLKALYFSMHTHIGVVEDIGCAKGEVFSPELRDDAQDARNRILQELNKIGGKEAFLALDEIAAKARQTPAFSYLDTLRREKAETDADLRPWPPYSVWEFHERQDRTPSTHRELAELGVLRLLDLKDDLEEGDDSVAAVVKAIPKETIMRNYIGHDLRQKAFGRYSIPHEEEMADAKRPDLRLHAVGIDAPVPVELKIADNWPGPRLFERLENQLAGDYLRDIRSARGIFVLVYCGKGRSRWQVPGTRRLVDFDGVLEALSKHWQSLSSKYPNVDDITVIGIDLTKRSK